MSELKPCPFCGSDGKVSCHNFMSPIGDFELDDVMCEKCGIYFETYTRDDVDAVTLCNHRPIEDAKDREIERLKAEVTRYRRALHNLKEDCQKRLHWKNSSWERLFLHEVITHIDAELDYDPDSTKGVEK